MEWILSFSPLCICMHRLEAQRGELSSVVPSQLWWLCWTTQAQCSGTEAEKILDHCHGFVRVRHWGTAEVRCDDCRCQPSQCTDIIISPLFKVSHAAKIQSALRNHHNNCANLQLALKFLLLMSSLASEWHAPRNCILPLQHSEDDFPQRKMIRIQDPAQPNKP